MSAFNSAIPSVLFGHNASVKAWCLTARVRNQTNTQAAFDQSNYIDGYNLRLDVESQYQQTGNTPSALVSVADVYSGALKFSFINPMVDANYKVFLQMYGLDTTPAPTYAYVLNSALYPKTKEYFWVRTGIPQFTGSSTDRHRIVGARLGIRVFRLGVVVL